MALTFTNLGVNAAPDINDSANSATFASASWTPPTDGLLLVFGHSREAAGANGPPTISGNNLTWVEIATVTFQAGDFRLTLWGADLAGSAAGVTSVDFGADIQLSFDASFIHVSDVDLSAGVLAAIVQIATDGDTTSGDSNAPSVALASAAADAANRCVAAFSHDANETTTPRANWTEADDLNGSGPVRDLATQYREDAFEQTASASWTTVSNWGGIVVELKAVTAGGAGAIDGGVADETAAVQGADLSGAGSVAVDGGLVTTVAAIAGADLAAAGSVSLDGGVVAELAVVNGADLAAAGAASLDAGLVTASISVFGADISSGAIPGQSIDAGLVDVAASVLGADLAAAGAAALEAGLVQLATELLGADLSPSGSVSIDAGLVSAVVTVKGADLALLVIPPPRVHGVAEYPVTVQIVEFSSSEALSEYVAGLGAPVVEFPVLVRLAGYDSPIVVVEYP